VDFESFRLPLVLSKKMTNVSELFSAVENTLNSMQELSLGGLNKDLVIQPFEDLVQNPTTCLTQKGLCPG